MWIQKGFQYAVCFVVSYKTLEFLLLVEQFSWIYRKGFDTSNHELLNAKLSAMVLIMNL